MIERNITVQELSTLAEDRKFSVSITGESALAMRKLIYDTRPMTILTDVIFLDNVHGINMMYEYYHFHDDYQLKEIAPNVFLPSPERAIIDTIVWLPENMNEGALIEALQNYQQKNGKEKLYECADHYNVPHEFVDVWWKEAEEESDMSMG